MSPRVERWAALLACALAAGTAHAQLMAQASAPPQTLTDAREVRGQLSPKRFTTLGAEIPAKVLGIKVLEGGAFSAGQVLLQFDCALQKSQADKARATLAAATVTQESNEALVKYDAIGKVELRVSQAEVLKARAELDASETVLGKCQVLAPFAGRLAEQKVREEQFVQVGQPLLDIIDDSALELEFIAPSSWLARLREGRNVRVRVDETGRSYLAKVSRLGARVDPVSQSIKVVAVIEGRPAELMAGMSGRITLAP